MSFVTRRLFGLIDSTEWGKNMIKYWPPHDNLLGK